MKPATVGTRVRKRDPGDTAGARKVMEINHNYKDEVVCC
jgi:hypothetical protein